MNNGTDGVVKHTAQPVSDGDWWASTDIRRDFAEAAVVNVSADRSSDNGCFDCYSVTTCFCQP
jgi:hypothetical protein